MPLSDHDQKVLDDMERDLHLTAPRRVSARFDHQPKSRPLRTLTLAITAVTVGIVLALSGLVLDVVFVSILGYVLIVGAIARATGRRSWAELMSRIKTMRPTSGNRPQ